MVWVWSLILFAWLGNYKFHFHIDDIFHFLHPLCVYSASRFQEALNNLMFGIPAILDFLANPAMAQVSWCCKRLSFLFLFEAVKHWWHSDLFCWCFVVLVSSEAYHFFHSLFRREWQPHLDAQSVQKILESDAWKRLRCLIEIFVAHEALHRGFQCFSVIACAACSLSGLNDKDLKGFSMMALYFFQLQGSIYPTALHCHNLSLHRKDRVNTTASLATSFTHLYFVSHCFTTSYRFLLNLTKDFRW